MTPTQDTESAIGGFLVRKGSTDRVLTYSLAEPLRTSLRRSRCHDDMTFN